MPYTFVRTLRTLSSERFLIQCKPGQDSAAIDLHYLDNGNVVGTLIIVDESLQIQERVPDLLQFIDESLLPMASLNERNLSFTVIHGKIAGQFDNEKQA